MLMLLKIKELLAQFSPIFLIGRQRNTKSESMNRSHKRRQRLSNTGPYEFCLRLLPLSLCLLLFSCGKTDSYERPSSDSSPKGGNPQAWMLDSVHYDTLAPNPTPLANSYNSIEELVETALRGFEERDTTLLTSLLITRKEYLDIIYPELGTHWPAARDMREGVQMFFWENQRNTSISGLLKKLRDLKEKRLELVTLEFADGVEEYPSYKLHTGTRLQIRTETGDTITFTTVGSIVEKDSTYKLLSYRDRD